MAKRMSLMLGVTAVLLAALGFVKFREVQSAVRAAAFQPPSESVTSIVAQREQWPATMDVIGTRGSGPLSYRQYRPSWHC
jgi:hypothetical protein